MSPSAVRDVHAVLAGAFKQAQVWGWIDHNPMTLVTRPAVRRTDVQPPQVAQAERLIDTAMAEDPELGLFLVLAVVLGARRGEVCRLRWSHIDLDRGEILVGGKITSLPGELRDEDWTKNRSKRRVAIGPAVVELLRVRRVEQAKQALASGVSLSSDAYVAANGRESRRYSPSFATALKHLGANVYVHSLSDPVQIQRFWDLGVGVYSDDPFPPLDTATTLREAPQPPLITPEFPEGVIPA
jgi:integrase